MVRFFKSRKPGPTDLTWEEKNSADYLYQLNNTAKSQDFNKHRSKNPVKLKKASPLG